MSMTYNSVYIPKVSDFDHLSEVDLLTNDNPCIDLVVSPCGKPYFPPADTSSSVSVTGTLALLLVGLVLMKWSR